MSGEMIDIQLNSIVIVTSRNPEIGEFGTAFPIYRDDAATYLVTCAHVVRDVGGSDQIMVRTVVGTTLPATAPASGATQGIDLAILRVEGLQNIPLLHLRSKSVSQGQPFTSAGFQQPHGDFFQFSSLQGHLGTSFQKGRAVFVDGWHLSVEKPDSLQHGNSGSPVFDENGHVLAVIDTQQGDGSRGTAISIEALTTIWRGMPQSLSQSLSYTPLPRQIGDYHDLEFLRSEGEILVCKGKDHRTGNEFAIRMLPMRENTTAWWQPIEQATRKFQRLRHRNILPVRTFRTPEGYACLATPFVPDGSLADLVKNGQQFPFDVALNYITEAAEALSYIHAYNLMLEGNLVHGNVTPNNVLRGNSGILLSGLAAIFDRWTPVTQADASSYRAPEQIAGAPATRESDQYALAATACWLLTGRSYAQGGLTDLRSTYPNIASNLERALDHNPVKRYPSMVFFITAWKRALLSAGDQPFVPPKHEQTPLPLSSSKSKSKTPDEPRPRWLRLAAAALVVVLLLGGLGVGLLRLTSGPITLCLATDLPLKGSNLTILHGVQTAFRHADGYDQTSNTITLSPAITLSPKYQLREFDLPMGSDDSSNPNQGVNNLTMLMTHKVQACINPVAVIGPYTSASAQREIPTAIADHILLLSPSNTDPCLTQPGNDCPAYEALHPPNSVNTYARLTPTDVEQGDKIVSLLENMLISQNKQNAPQMIDIVDDGEPYGDQLAKIVAQEFSVKGFKPTINVYCASTGQSCTAQSFSHGNFSVHSNYEDMTILANTIQNSFPHPDAIFYSGLVSNTLSENVSQLRHGLTNPIDPQTNPLIPLFVPSAIYEEGAGFFTDVGANFANITATFPAVPLPSALLKKYHESFNSEMPGPYSGNAYDAANIVITTLKEVIGDGGLQPLSEDDLVAGVSSQVFNQPFTSITGDTIDLNSDGDNIETHHYSVYTSSSSGWLLDKTHSQ